MENHTLRGSVVVRNKRDREEFQRQISQRFVADGVSLVNRSKALYPMGKNRSNKYSGSLNIPCRG